MKFLPSFANIFNAISSNFFCAFSFQFEWLSSKPWMCFTLFYVIKSPGTFTLFLYDFRKSGHYSGRQTSRWEGITLAVNPWWLHRIAFRLEISNGLCCKGPTHPVTWREWELRSDPRSHHRSSGHESQPAVPAPKSVFCLTFSLQSCLTLWGHF